MPEVCNGLDDDCDGLVDWGWCVQPGVESRLYSSSSPPYFPVDTLLPSGPAVMLSTPAEVHFMARDGTLSADFGFSFDAPMATIPPSGTRPALLAGVKASDLFLLRVDDGGVPRALDDRAMAGNATLSPTVLAWSDTPLFVTGLTTGDTDVGAVNGGDTLGGYPVVGPDMHWALTSSLCDPGAANTFIQAQEAVQVMHAGPSNSTVLAQTRMASSVMFPPVVIDNQNGGILGYFPLAWSSGSAVVRIAFNVTGGTASVGVFQDWVDLPRISGTLAAGVVGGRWKALVPFEDGVLRMVDSEGNPALSVLQLAASALGGVAVVRVPQGDLAIVGDAEGLVHGVLDGVMLGEPDGWPQQVPGVVKQAPLAMQWPGSGRLMLVVVSELAQVSLVTTFDLGDGAVPLWASARHDMMNTGCVAR